MWQRFSERARRVVFFSQEEAGKLGESFISTEHLLLGLLRVDDCVACRILDRMGVTLEKIRSEIERQAVSRDGKLAQDIDLAPRAKRIIDLAYDEARQLNNNYIGTEHLLLGLIREEEGLAGRVLSLLGVELEKTREEVRKRHTQEPSDKSSAPLVPPVPRFKLTPGDLGVLQSDDPHVMAFKLTSERKSEFDLIWDARDSHGWKKLVEQDVIVEIPAGTSVKFLRLEPGNLALVRVLEGQYEGQALNVLWTSFVFTRKDDAPWPPEK